MVKKSLTILGMKKLCWQTDVGNKITLSNSLKIVGENTQVGNICDLLSDNGKFVIKYG